MAKVPPANGGRPSTTLVSNVARPFVAQTPRASDRFPHGLRDAAAPAYHPPPGTNVPSSPMSPIERPRGSGQTTSRFVRGLAIVAVLALLGGCDSGPTAAPSAGVTPSSTPASPSLPPTMLPSPTVAAAAEFPLAVVTGLTNRKGTISIDELTALADEGDLLVPCGVDVLEPALKQADSCVDANKIRSALEASQKQVALLPPGLVETATKVLPIAGDGPYGLFGPDLFGDPESRALPYPVQGRETVAATLDQAWTAYDASKVWNMTSIGSLCSDRWAAHQAVTLGKGWNWVFGGGTAEYNGRPILNPNKPPVAELAARFSTSASTTATVTFFFLYPGSSHTMASGLDCCR